MPMKTPPLRKPSPANMSPMAPARQVAPKLAPPKPRLRRVGATEVTHPQSHSEFEKL